MQNPPKYLGVIISLNSLFMIKLLLSDVETWFITFFGVHLHFGTYPIPYLCKTKNPPQEFHTEQLWTLSPRFISIYQFFSMVNLIHLQDKDDF